MEEPKIRINMTMKKMRRMQWLYLKLETNKSIHPIANLQPFINKTPYGMTAKAPAQSSTLTSKEGSSDKERTYFLQFRGRERSKTSCQKMRSIILIKEIFLISEAWERT